MRFTAETAVIAAKTSHGPNSKRWLPRPARTEITFIAETAPKPAEDDPFVIRTIARVRKQINKIELRLSEVLEAEELDASGVDRLCSAISRLADLERTLSGRPLPGSRKPAPDRQDKRRSAPAMPESEPDTPQQVVSCGPAVHVQEPPSTPPVQ